MALFKFVLFIRFPLERIDVESFSPLFMTTILPWATLHFDCDNSLLTVCVLGLAKHIIIIINMSFKSRVLSIAYSLLYWKISELPVRLLCPFTRFCQPESCSNSHGLTSVTPLRADLFGLFYLQHCFAGLVCNFFYDWAFSFSGLQCILSNSR